MSDYREAVAEHNLTERCVALFSRAAREGRALHRLEMSEQLHTQLGNPDAVWGIPCSVGAVLALIALDLDAEGDIAAREVRYTELSRLRVFGFVGYAGSGKTTASEYLLDEAVKEGLRACRLSFAHALRTICMIAYPWVPREYFCGNKAQKETQIPGMPEGTTGRKILQLIGTEAFRSINDETWTKLVEYQIKQSQEREDMDVIVIDDVRFPNEHAMLKRIGATTIRCNRAPTSIYHFSEPKFLGAFKPSDPILVGTPPALLDFEVHMTMVAPIHESEAHVASLPVDIDIDNNGTLDELTARVRSLLDT